MTATLTLDEPTALKIYPTAPPELKAILEQSFAKGFFSMKITDRIKSVEDSFKINPPDPNLKMLLDYTGTNYHLVGARTFLELSITAEALREGWIPDYDNSDQKKWYQIFIKRGSGWAFGGSDYGYANALTTAGSRFAFQTKELSDYFGNQFIKQHQILLSNK